MGLLKNIGRLITSNIVIPTANIIGSGINLIAGKKVATSVTAEEVFGGKAGKVYETILGGSASALALVSIPIIIKKIIPVIKTAPLKSAVTGAVAIIGGSAILQSPTLQEKVVNTNIIGSLSEFGGNIGGVIESPSIASITELVKDNPILAGAVAVLGIGAIGKAVIPAVSGFITQRKLGEQTDILKEIQSGGGMQTLETTPNYEGGFIPMGNNQVAGKPLSQPVVSIAGKRKRGARTKEKPSIRQNVRVNVINSSRATGTQISNKRYLNQLQYA